MSGPYFVEILARNGEVRRRERFEQLPIRIGRGYDNDVILDDAQAAIHHAQIEANAEGELVAREAGGRIVHRGRREAQMAIDGHTVLRLGHTIVRVRSASFAIGAATEQPVADGWRPALAGLALVVLLTLWGSWVADTEDIDKVQYFTAQAGALTMVLIWCGLWALAGRLFAGQMRFGRHLLIAGCGLAVMEVVNVLSGTAAFALSLEFLTRYGSHVMIALGLGIVYFHLLAINPMHRRGFAVVCVVLALLGSGIRLMTNYQSGGRVSDEMYMSELYSPALRISGSGSVDEFFASAATLQAKLDAARNEKVKLDGEQEE